MKKRTKTSFDRYVTSVTKKHPRFKKELEKADRAWDVALQIRQLRKKRGFTQAQLARLAGISQPNIARIEDADYQRYTLTSLEKVTQALNATIDVIVVPDEEVAKHRKHLSRPVFSIPV